MPVISAPIEVLLDQVLILKGQMDEKAAAIIDATMFAPISLKRPTLVPSELGFLKVASWLYVLWNEAGDVNVDFLLDCARSYGFEDSHKPIATYLQTVHHLRTLLQHNLGGNSDHDNEISEFCSRWFTTQCGCPEPQTEPEWYNSLSALLTQTIDCMRRLVSCLDAILLDDFQHRIRDDWMFQRSRCHPAHSFDPIIIQAAADLGRRHVNVKALRNRFYQKWNTRLQLLTGDYDFEREARRLIEDALLSDDFPGLPITGEDIMEEFGLEPGPQVGEALRFAKQIYQTNRCGQQDLLAKVRERMKG